ncbi:MAG: hypothetical protein F6K10_42585 [Moorea sp. SIO2B7]|nr:hypothetical protein [Moorena sp. SIO2B7]
MTPRSKTILYRVFQIGKIPQDVLSQIHHEGFLLKDEGIGGSVTFRKFRAPGKYYGWKRSWFSGSIVLTRDHFFAFKYSEPIIGFPWDNDKIKELNYYTNIKNLLNSIETISLEDKTLLVQQLQENKDYNSSDNPWIKYAGMFKYDPQSATPPLFIFP